MDQEQEQSHRPLPESEGERLGYEVGVSFAPSLRLESKEALLFGTKLAGSIPPTSVQIETNRWTYSASGVQLTVTPTTLTLSASTPPLPTKDSFEQRYRVILNLFAQEFSPKLLMYSRALFCALVPIDGDSRVFVGSHLLGFRPKRLGVFGRPTHGLGIRLYFPQYEKEQNDEIVPGEDWNANVKLESWLEDPRKLFVEIEGFWPDPSEWDTQAETRAADRLDTVTEFFRGKLLPFLRYDDEQDHEEVDDGD